MLAPTVHPLSQNLTTLSEKTGSQNTFSNSPTSMICLTMYNEPFSEFAKTLSNLLRSIRQAHMVHIDAAKETCIAIIIDGVEHADPEVIDFLQRVNLVNLDNLSSQETDFVFGDIAIADLIPHSKNTIYDEQRNPCVVALKSQNQGKLHSHSLFYSNLCQQLNPKYCFQIDVGTMVEVDAISEMLKYLESNTHIASAGSTIVTNPWENGEGIITDWQFMDFSTQAAVNWPAEILSGHLSVLPGQFSAIRWEALSGQLKPSTIDNVLPLHHDTVIKNEEAPIDRYLRGLEAETDVDRIMFLAEDRIIGNEIILSEGNDWKLGFCSDAHATTDACENMDELLRQRRRWNNSSTACKLWLLTRWKDYSTRSDRSFANKIGFSTAMIWQFLLIVHQILAPAFVISLGVLAIQAISGWVVQEKYLLLSMLFATSTVGGLLSIHLRAASKQKRQYTTSKLATLESIRGGCTFAVGCLLIGALISMLPTSSAIFMLVPAMIGLLMTCIIFKKKSWTILTKAPEYYMLANPLIQARLWFYSLTNLHDVTWGTKGLTESAAGSPSNILSKGALTLWISLNAGVAYLALSSSTFLFNGLDPYLEVRFLIGGAMVMMAMILHMNKLIFSGKKNEKAIDLMGETHV